MLRCPRARRAVRGWPLLSAGYIIGGALALSCAPLDGSGKNGCVDKGDCIGTHVCCDSECMPPELCCDQCFRDDVYRQPCHLRADPESRVPLRPGHYGFMITETVDRVDRESNDSMSRPGYDLDCSDSIDNVADSDTRWDPGACESTVLGTEPPQDAAEGVDNSFLGDFLAALRADLPAEDRAEIRLGDESSQMAITISEYGGTVHDRQVTVSLLYADLCEESEAGGSSSHPYCLLPTTEGRSFLSADVTPRYQDDDAYVSNYHVVARLEKDLATRAMNVVLFVRGPTGELEPIRLRIRNPVLTFELVPNAQGEIVHITRGVLSGVWFEDEWPRNLESYEEALKDAREGKFCAPPTPVVDNPQEERAAELAGGGAGPGMQSGAGSADGGAEASTSDSAHPTCINADLQARFGAEPVLKAWASALDMQHGTGSQVGARGCNAVSFAIGFASDLLPVAFRCPVKGVNDAELGGTISRPMEYGECAWLP